MNDALVVLVRGIIGFFTLFIFTRLLGKQQISQLTFFDYVLGITIGSTASTLTTDLNSSAWPHWIGILTWIVLVLILQWGTIKSRKASQYINGMPTVVIMKGKVMENEMRKMRYNLSDLLEQLRQKDVFDISQVEFAVLESNGNLSVLKKSPYQPLTPKDMNIPTQYSGLSTELIYDGIIIDAHLEKVNLDRAWLFSELRKQKVNDPSEVFLAVLETSGTLYIDLVKDRIQTHEKGDAHE